MLPCSERKLAHDEESLEKHYYLEPDHDTVSAGPQSVGGQRAGECGLPAAGV